MSLALDRPEFAPPPQRGTPRAVLLALVAHALLIAALTWGVRWRSDADEGAVDAELWSSTVQQAAPRLSAPQAPTPAPAPPPPAPPPPPPPQVKAPEPAPAPRAPDIALEREKKLKEEKEQKERELERQQQQRKKELEAKQRAEDEAERKKAQQQKLAEQQKKQQQEAEAKQAEAKKQQEAAAKQAAADRAATLKRMQGLAGASGSDDSKGTAMRSSGPSSGYAGRIAAAVRPNITFPDAETVNGNPAAEFEVNLAPDGTIVGVKLTKSSGLPSWDEAAERGLHKTDKLPRDTDGRIFPSLIVSLRPKR
ncbi:MULTISPECIES: cell envelope integrity protein TolA [Variovorax]|uniref:Colicin import membrane protein n=2 Tax=Variovorax TaxID=34072 RepID=A0AAE3Y365_VARPD|nr:MULTISPECIES: cell envelope integrity protein TolA [Variovorax]MDP9965001.1 colicin import membrane protein [Variovorax paradoxus]MDR6428498.1 colicin import membrane protein [Variovorax paradoxus]MDR6455152.1 colicin import membrane protein [Variovorax paradoxus]TWD85148.1 cell division and transport-associated protein TolA [Variovorax beijingensis]